MLLQMGANGASVQELQIAPKNMFRANFLDKALVYFFLNECCFLLFTIEIIPNNKSKQQITNHKSIHPESSSLTASLNTPKSEAAVVAPCSSIHGILMGMMLGILSVLHANATHAEGGARVGGTVAGT
jgi:hypothetical protein